jgi:K+-sensing histidine kinase KdpD
VYDGTINHGGGLRMSAPESKPWKAEFAGGVTPHVDARWQMRYGVACGVVAVAFLLRLTFFGSLDTRLPFGFFTLGVMVVAWYGGLGPSLLAAAAGLLLGGYFFLPHTGTSGALGEAERTAILVYVVNAMLVSFLMDNLHTRIKKLKCYQAKSMRQPPDAKS